MYYSFETNQRMSGELLARKFTFNVVGRLRSDLGYIMVPVKKEEDLEVVGRYLIVRGDVHINSISIQSHWPQDSSSKVYFVPRDFVAKAKDMLEAPEESA